MKLMTEQLVAVAEQLLTACKSVLKNEEGISETGKMVLILAINAAEPKNEEGK